MKSADRTVSVLEHLSLAERPLSLRELSDDLGVPRASMYALLVTLQRRGWVESDGSSFRLGIRSLRLGAAYLEADDVLPLVTPVLDGLNSTFDETVHLARLDHSDILYLTTRPSRRSLAVQVRPGRRLPAWLTALGKSILAELPWDEVDALLPDELEGRTPSSITTREALRQELEATRERGFAIDDEESMPGIRCFAVPVRAGQASLDAISISVPVNRLDETREQEIATELLRASQDLRVTS